MAQGGAGQTAVSSVIGTVLVLGITVAVFAGLALFVLGPLSGTDETPRSTLAAVRGDDAYLLVHRGGDPVPLDAATLFVGAGTLQREVPLTDFAAETDGTAWRLGESLCVSCRFPGHNITGVHLVTPDTLLLREGTLPDARLVSGIDLRVDGPRSDPADPLAGQTVTLEARVTNAGTQDAAPVRLDVLVDGSVVGTATVASIPSGQATYVGVSWTATAGVHDVDFVADPDDALPEASETNNQASMQMDVPAGAADPGFAYEDADRDGLYEIGTDAPLDAGQLDDGVHDAGTADLVVPSSVGALSATAWDLSGADLHVHVPLSATAGDVLLTATDDAVLHDLDAAGAVNLQAGGSTDLSARTILSGGAATLGATDIDLTGTVLRMDPGADLVVQASGVLAADGADLELQGAATLTAGSASLDGARLTNLASTQDLTVQTTPGALSLVGADLDTDGHVLLTGATGVDASNARLTTPTSPTRDVSVTAQAGDVDVRGAHLEADDRITLTVPDATRSVFVEGATFIDRDGNANVEPDGTAVGTPAQGGVS